MPLHLPAERIEMKTASAFSPGSLVLVTIGQAGPHALALRCSWQFDPEDPVEAMLLMLQPLHERTPAGVLLETRSLREPVLGVEGRVSVEVDYLARPDGERWLQRDGKFGHLGFARGGAFISGLYQPMDPTQAKMLWVRLSDWTALTLSHAEEPETVFSHWRLRLQGGTESEPWTINIPAEPA